MRKVEFLLVIGILMAACVSFVPSATPTSSPSPTLRAGTPQPPTPGVTPILVAISGNITVSNPTMLGRNLHDAPGLDARVVALLLPGESALALEKDESGKWVLVNYHDKQLWVYADQITLSATLDSLPVIFSNTTPTP